MAITESLQLPLGSKMIDFSLRGTNDEVISMKNFEKSRILLIVFTCNHCPYAIASWPTLINLQAQFKSQSVQFIAINPNDTSQYPDDNFDAMKNTVQKLGINFPYLLDESQNVAKAYQAQCTPDIYVFDESRLLKYHGRINDNWQEPNKVTSEDLKDALLKLLEEKLPSNRQYPSMGCSIKWKKE